LRKSFQRWKLPCVLALKTLQNLNRHVRKARREIQRKASEAEKQHLKGLRWILVKNQDHLNETEQDKLNQMYTVCPTLGTSGELKEEFRSIFETAPNRSTAADQLSQWIAKVQQTGIKRLEKFITTLQNWCLPILNYFNHHITGSNL